ncbi:MAG: Ppx/GppA family phosphatase, partial [Pseudomonadota bacterium]
MRQAGCGEEGGGTHGVGAVRASHRPAPVRAPEEALLGALDLGTNNCRLLIARPADNGFAVIDAFSRPVKLGEGMERTNVLGATAQDRALKALRICAAKLRQHRVANARIVATEACRRAANGRSFVRRVLRETGLQMSIISAEEEARLAVAGCSPLIDPASEQLLVIDIGGGSTELIWVDMSHTPPARRQHLVRALAPLMPGDQCHTARAAEAHITDWISVPLGVSTLHDRFAGIGQDNARFAAMSEHFESFLSEFRPYRMPRRAAASRGLQVMGVSGTATTYGALHLDLKAYDRGRVDGLWMPCAAAEALTER